MTLKEPAAFASGSVYLALIPRLPDWGRKPASEAVKLWRFNGTEWAPVGDDGPVLGDNA